EGTDLALRRDESQHGVDPDAEPLETGADREFGTVRPDRILQEDVQQALAPEKLGIVAEARRAEIRQRLLARGEGATRLGRAPGVQPPGVAEPDAALVRLDLVAEPEGRGFAQGAIDALEVEEAAVPPRHVDVAHRLERNARKQEQRPPLRLQESLDADVFGDVLRARGDGQRR